MLVAILLTSLYPFAVFIEHIALEIDYMNDRIHSKYASADFFICRIYSSETHCYVAHFAGQLVHFELGDHFTGTNPARSSNADKAFIIRVNLFSSPQPELSVAEILLLGEYLRTHDDLTCIGTNEIKLYRIISVVSDEYRLASNCQVLIERHYLHLRGILFRG